MGFKRAKADIKIQFGEDHELHGLEIISRRVRMRDMLDITALAGMAEATMQQKVTGVDKLCERFAGILLSWNLEDEDGGAIPCTYEGLMDQDLSFVLQVVRAWIDGVSGVADPLPQPSRDGAQQKMASLPMDNS